MTSKERLFRVLAWTGAALAAGGAYVGVIRRLGLGLDCPIWSRTGLYCPGCGVSRMCLRLLRLDFAGALRANPLLLLSLPVIAGLLGARAARYVRSGGGESPRWERLAWVALAVAFVGYGVIRNLPGMGFLAPA